MLMALSSNPPVFSIEEAQRAARSLYGIDAVAEPKSSERDNNFRMNGGVGADVVLKVCNVNEDPAVIDVQIAALRHIEMTDPTLPVPRVVPTLSGDLRTQVASRAGENLMVFALTYCSGVTLWDVVLTPQLMFHIGATVARLGVALKTFSQDVPEQELVWDIRSAEALRPHVPLIGDAEGERLVTAALDRFSDHTLPLMSRLRHQVIHNDTNRGNVLVMPELASPVTGIIDFGDMVKGPLILDISTAAMELAASADDPIGLTEGFLEGYVGATPLSAEEVGCIYDALMTRLAVCVLVYAWRGAHNAEPRYDAGAVVRHFIGEMKHMDAIGRNAAEARFHAVCGTG